MFQENPLIQGLFFGVILLIGLVGFIICMAGGDSIGGND